MKPIIYEDEQGAWDEQDVKDLIAENKRLLECLEQIAQVSENESDDFEAASIMESIAKQALGE